MDKNPSAKPQAADDAAPREDIRETIKKVVGSDAMLKSKEDKVDMAKVQLQIFEKGKPPYQAMGMSEEEVAAIYFYGFKIFNAGQTKEALEVFKILFTLKPSADYALCLGSCYHKLKDYKAAATMYTLAIQYNPMDPVPFFYSYDCFMNMGNLGLAKSSLSHALTNARQDLEKYRNIEEKASLLYDAVDAQIKKQEGQNAAEK